MEELVKEIMFTAHKRMTGSRIAAVYAALRKKNYQHLIYILSISDLDETELFLVRELARQAPARRYTKTGRSRNL